MCESSGWRISSWRNCPIAQQPDYTDKEALSNNLDEVRRLPPLVHRDEIIGLKKQLSEVSMGKMFLLQGGDCAEGFTDCTRSIIENKLSVILQMSLIILWRTHIPTLKILRIAGQYAKPRSSPTEKINGKVVPSFRGVNVNSVDPSNRNADPRRLVDAYFHSAATLNYIRMATARGFDHLQNIENWGLSGIKSCETRAQYTGTIKNIVDGLAYSRFLGDSSKNNFNNFFTSHEALLLNYEETLTECIENKYYNTSAHFVWIGDRTRQLDGAHVEYCRGLENPIGIKVGPSLSPEDLTKLLVILNPNRECGKITLITRYGHENVLNHLPGHILAVRDSNIPVVWCCDPCHGNTEPSRVGCKTRLFDTIIREIQLTFQVHSENNSLLNGVHMELTGDHVTECVGGSCEIGHDDLPKNYQTLCDPRLNYTQSIDASFRIAEEISRYHSKFR